MRLFSFKNKTRSRIENTGKEQEIVNKKLKVRNTRKEKAI